MTNKAKKLSKKSHIENKNISRKENKKIQWIELGRALAIICVLLCHSVEIVYSSNLTINHYLNMEFMAGLSDLSKIFSHLTFTIGRLGVPIFLMITGYLMLDRNYDKAGCKIFYKRNFLHIFLCAEIWIIIYNIFFMIYRNEAFSLSDLLKEMFFINWVNLDHWWFMNMIVIVYLLLPIAANIIKHCNKKFLKAIFIFYCIYTGLYKIIDDILLAFGRKDLPDSISLGYTYGIFVIYLVMGYLIKKGILKKLSTITLTYIAILFFGIIFIFQVLAYSIGNGFNVWYDCPVLWISTVAIFELLSRVKTIKCYKLVQNISHYSFAIYFVHIIIRELLFKFIPSTTVWLPLYVILLTIVLFITTWFIVIIIDKIPKVGKILFNIK